MPGPLSREHFACKLSRMVQHPGVGLVRLILPGISAWQNYYGACRIILVYHRVMISSIIVTSKVSLDT